MTKFPLLTAEQLIRIKDLHLAGTQPSDIAEIIQWRPDHNITAGQVRHALRSAGFKISEPNAAGAPILPWPKRPDVPWPTLPALWMDEPGKFTDDPRAGTWVDRGHAGTFYHPASPPPLSGSAIQTLIDS